MSNHVRNRDMKRGGSRNTKVSRYRRSRPKSFKTEEAAKRWAEDQGLKDYTLKNLRSAEASTKKIIIIK